jgi:hypothetical protein
MMEMVQEAINQAFLNFRNMRRAESQARSTPGLDTAMTTTSSTNQDTSTETLFQPPPSVIHPVNFFGNELYLGRQNCRNNTPSDSGYASRPSLSNSSNYAPSDKIERDVAFSSGVSEEQPRSGLENSPTFDFSQFGDFSEVVESEAFGGMDLPGHTYRPENTPTTSISVPAPPTIHTSTQNRHVNDNLFVGDTWLENTELREMTDLDFDTSMDIWE